MSFHHLPVLVWRDAAGFATAVLLGDFEWAVATAEKPSEAMHQLKEVLEWRAVNEPWNLDPDLTEPALVEVKVEVRPQYQSGNRMIPCPETVWMRVPCVTGKQASGLHLCLVPHWAIRFNYRSPAELPSLVAHYAKDTLQRLTPGQLAGQLPPRDCRLEEIVVREAEDRNPRVPPSDRPELKSLFGVADPILHDQGRRRPGATAYGRESLVEALARRLGPDKANVLLVGEPGVGKSTVLRDAAKRLARAHPAAGAADEDDAKDLRSYRFWRTSGGRLIAGMRYLGEWEERCEEFVEQLNAIDGIFCAESLVELARVGGQGPAGSVAAFLLPYLERGELRMVAEATPDEVEACRRILPGLLDRFQIVTVPAFDDAAAIQALQRVASAYANASRREIEPGLPTLVHRLFRRFQPYASFPGPAATFVRKLCDARAGCRAAERSTVTARDAVDLFAQETGLPEVFLRDDLPLSLETVREQIATQIIGQPGPTEAATRLVASIKSGMTDPMRPLGVLLFCGPTGVGKTALARTLVDVCFGASGQKDRLVRLDMSEFSGWGAAQRFLQDPQDRPAPWIERVRRQPFCVVLLDEIEKAAPEVFDALLGVLDEGRLTDRFGRVTWFRSAIIIMTSNLGVSAAAGGGFGPPAPISYEAEVARFFRPEFFNRLDAVLTFHPLSREHIQAITRKELAELAAREGFATAGLTVQWSERLVAAVAREGYDHRLGARPLQRALETLVAVPLARWRVRHPKVRDVILHVDLDREEVRIQQEKRS